MNHRNRIFLTCLNRSPEFKAPSTPTRRIKNMRFQNVRIRFLAWVERSDDRKYACVRRLYGHCLTQKEGRSFVVFTIRALINI